jgi:sec-independent protein translocase protein TatB
MFGLSFPKLALVGIIAVFILGPDRLPQMAARLASLVKTVRTFSDAAKERVREEMGPEFDDFDWQKLDPRQYDPRRIIREALLESDDEPTAATTETEQPTVRPAGTRPARAGFATDADVEPLDIADYDESPSSGDGDSLSQKKSDSEAA